MMSMRFLGALAALAALPACAPRPLGVLAVLNGPPTMCEFRGRWQLGEVAGRRSGAAFAEVHGAEAAGALFRAEAGPVLRVNARSHGWTVRGVADLAGATSLRPQRALALSELVTAHIGADIVVRDARPGEALVAPGRFAFGGDEGMIRFAAEPARWVPCDALGFAFTFRDEHTEERERVAMGYAADLPAQEVPAATAVDLAATPGGAPQAHVPAREYGLEVRPLGTEGSFTRVLLQHWTSFALVAWLPSAALAAPSEGGLGGLMGGLGAHTPRALTLCRAPVELTFAFARPDEALEYAGTIAAGTEFERGAAAPDGGFVVSPHGDDVQLSPARGVTWVAHAATGLACREVTE